MYLWAFHENGSLLAKAYEENSDDAMNVVDSWYSVYGDDIYEVVLSTNDLDYGEPEQ